jgi:uncharacterized protein (DUF302 family)
MIPALLMALISLLSCSIAAEAHQINLTNARVVVGPDRSVDVEIAMRGSDADRVGGTHVFDEVAGLVEPIALAAASVPIIAYVTADRLSAGVEARGMTLFARIDHAAGAAEVGLPLRPTELLLFGNAKGGTPLMQSNQMIGIDLPLKALIWQDEAGKAWLCYNDPSWLANRHGLGPEVDPTLHAMAIDLAAIAREATGSP